MGRFLATLCGAWLGFVWGCGQTTPHGADTPGARELGGDSVAAATRHGGSGLDPLEIEITGQDFQWHVRYAGPDGKLGTGDDIHAERHFHLPLGTKTRILLKSKDYIYTWSLPEFGLKEIAVPDLTFSLEFIPSAVGDYQVLGDQMCGYAHEELLGVLTVQSPSDFRTWQNQQSSP